MNNVTKKQTKQPAINCPQCGWPLLMEPASELHIVPCRDTSLPKEGLKYLGRLKCPRCRNQIILYYN